MPTSSRVLYYLQPSVGATLAVARGRGNRRSAASGGGSKPVSRKCPDWRVRQCPSVGRHNGGQESPAPTRHQEPTAPGGQGRPPLRSSIDKRCVGADAHIGPPHRTINNAPVGGGVPDAPSLSCPHSKKETATPTSDGFHFGELVKLPG